MSKKFTLSILAFFILYSLTLILVESFSSQDFVRNYYTDIGGHFEFYAVNTTISCFLLSSTALIFVLCIPLTTSNTSKRELKFIYSQILVFLYLAIDDRFKIHDNWRVENLLGGMEIFCCCL
jgi:hypothetical protein